MGPSGLPISFVSTREGWGWGKSLQTLIVLTLLIFDHVDVNFKVGTSRPEVFVFLNLFVVLDRLSYDLVSQPGLLDNESSGI